MTIVLILFTIIGLLGAFDTLYHHEFKERLSWRPEVKDELSIHALRNVFYFIVFITLAWFEWHGVWAWVFLAILVIEIFVTFTDFALEGKVRDVPSAEIIVHALLGIVYGATLAYLIPEILKWAEQPTAFTSVSHGFFSFIMTVYAFSVLIFSLRDYMRSKEIDNFRQNYAMQLTQKCQKVLMTGGSGFIGSKVAEALIDDGHEVTVLTRDFKNSINKFSKNVRLVHSLDALNSSFDLVFNLAGESINQRWTTLSKEKIRQSRLEMTQEVVSYINKQELKPKLLISSSGTGIYPASEDEVFTEVSTTIDNTFTSSLSKVWETEALKADAERVVLLRTGLVLGTDGGFLAEMLMAFDFGLGGKLGSGKQMMPWIAMHDMLGAIEHIVNIQRVDGVVNATAPNPVSNEVFSQMLAKSMRRPMFLATPTFMLNLFFGKEMVKELLLEGRAVLPAKLEEHGYKFKFTKLEDALNNLFRKEK